MQDAAKRSPSYLDEQLNLISLGDKSALAALYECASASIYAYAMSMLRSQHDAEDVLQDALLEIWRSAGSYKSMGKPMAWIITITRNLCLMRLRRRSMTAEEPLEPSIHEAEAPGLSPEDGFVIRACLEELESREREIVILHAVSGLKHREIAEILRMPLSTVLSKYNRAVKKLKRALQEDTEGGYL